jgi:hypothetical protein
MYTRLSPGSKLEIPVRKGCRVMGGSGPEYFRALAWQIWVILETASLAMKGSNNCEFKM